MAGRAPGRAAARAPAGTDAWLDESRGRWEEVARTIWSFHETALQERQSSALLAALLENPSGSRSTTGP